MQTTRCPMLLAAVATAAALALPAPVAAFEQVTRAADFTSLVETRQLSRFGIRLQVLPTSSDAGRIRGRAFGYDVTGEWRWQDGYFCRAMDWGGTEIEHNCQAVLRDGNALRFVSDRGRGEHADFRLR